MSQVAKRGYHAPNSAWACNSDAASQAKYPEWRWMFSSKVRQQQWQQGVCRQGPHRPVEGSSELNQHMLKLLQALLTHES